MHLRLIVQVSMTLMAAVLSAVAAEHRVVSPDGKLALIVSDTEGLNYRVEVDGQALLKPSRLGLQFAGEITLGPAAIIRSSKNSQHDGQW